MFKQEIFDFNGFDAVRLSDDSQNSIEVLPEKGGLLLSLKLKGKEKLDGVKTLEELNQNPWGKSILLYPFPNRMKAGKFSFEGKEFQFPINDESTGNALHGFGAKQKMKIDKISLSDTVATLELSFNYQGQYEYFPWKFNFGISYSISSNAALEVKFKVKNIDTQKMPFGMGWHPYFNIGKDGSCSKLTLPKVSKIEVDENLIPNGERLTLTDFEAPKCIGEYKFDTGFELSPEETLSRVKLSNTDEAPLYYWQESGTQQFRYLQVFIPPQRESIAFEPMTCNIDAFNNKNGLWTLQPGESKSLTCGVQLSEKK